ncbi:hypothetical protein BHM03_00035462 [Ensete ventricosum]|uniref:Uncharacterized protein n=1 Tax=Ensete ventricosum TaxID=4639 RepID=A0A445MJE8_ENSVE|nr:hypothetical protein BHM03_00035462 [Ensete ventricosum]
MMWWKPRRKFARRFTEGIGKLAGNMSGDRQKKTIGLTARIPEATRLGGTKCKGLVFTKKRSVVDADMPQERGLGSGRRPLVPNHYKSCEFFPFFYCLRILY